MNTSSKSHLTENSRNLLLEIAWSSIRQGLDSGRPLTLNPIDYPLELQEKRASFVTLNHQGTLRGCIGHLEAQAPLAIDVAENAFSAAFQDPRFPPLDKLEIDNLTLHISVLTPSSSLLFESEADLIEKIRPGIDGLILVEGRHRGTFLPSVWESLPDTQSFLHHLKQKAGLPGDYWSESIKVFRYETESFP
ncbi:MAG: AmmeMemoRadiSam system protein A [Candidatus Thiodiazotropha sp.]